MSSDSHPMRAEPPESGESECGSSAAGGHSSFEAAVEPSVDTAERDWCAPAVLSPAEWAGATESTEFEASQASVPQEPERTTVEQRQWISGQKVGRYQLEKLIGRGACGEVWSARDPVLGRMVAIKVPRLNRMKDWPWLPHAIWAEARAAARAASLSCCVPVFDFGWADAPTCYIVMQLMEVSVAELIRCGPMRPRTACRLIYSVCRKLHRAHLEGLVHCDLKPSNLLLDSNGDVFPSDFSTTMPRVLLAAESDLFVGTLPYMAPEQLEGRAFDYDCRTDCYALGVVLYEMLAGRRPFAGETADELVREIRRAQFRPLREAVPEIPRRLEELVAEALSYYRHRRPPDVRLFGTHVFRTVRRS